MSLGATAQRFDLTTAATPPTIAENMPATMTKSRFISGTRGAQSGCSSLASKAGPQHSSWARSNAWPAQIPAAKIAMAATTTTTLDHLAVRSPESAAKVRPATAATNGTAALA